MPGDRRKILILDDEPIVADTTARTLKIKFQHEEILVQTTASRALDILNTGDVAVFLCDLAMPEMDGVAMLREANKCNPNTVSALITGRATTQSLMTAFNAGHLWKCIEKPWTVDQLLNLVKDALDLYESRTAADKESAQVQKPQEQNRFRIEKPSLQIVVRKPKKVLKQIKKPVIRFKGQPKKSLVVPDVIANRYRDLTLIAEGGSASVYKAEDSLLKMPVAIKIIAERYAQQKEAMEVLFNEARIAMQLSHKHIVRLHNIQQSNGLSFLVMEYIDGDTLRTILNGSGPLSGHTVLQIINICEDTLGYAHRHNIFHRDLKPDNIMLTEDGLLKIIDFGVACLAIETMKSRDDVYGTPYYMSPEEIHGSALDQRTDIYSLGVMIHELLTGFLPRDGRSSENGDPLDYVPVAYRELPLTMRLVLQKSFAANPEERWSNVNEFSENFRRAYAECGGDAAVWVPQKESEQEAEHDSPVMT